MSHVHSVLVLDVMKGTRQAMDPLADYERHHGIGLAQLVRRREVQLGELLEAAIACVDECMHTESR